MRLLSRSVENFFALLLKRESIRSKKEAGKPWPWTSDPILQTYKFTNVKREHDRTSRLLIKEFYTPNYDAPREQILLNCALARYFGTVEFMRAIGWQKTFDPDRLIGVAKSRRAKGLTVYTGAYIITSGNTSGPKEETIVKNYLTPLWEHHKNLCLPWKAWQPFILTLQQLPGFGGTGFMAKEVALDTRYTGFWPEQPLDRYSWTPVGPGSARGAGRLLGLGLVEKKRGLRPVKASPEQTLEVCRELFDLRSKYLPKTFVELELHDIQFQLCEFDKYERVRLGQGKPRSRYTRREPSFL